MSCYECKYIQSQKTRPIQSTGKVKITNESMAELNTILDSIREKGTPIIQPLLKYCDQQEGMKPVPSNDTYDGVSYIPCRYAKLYRRIKTAFPGTIDSIHCDELNLEKSNREFVTEKGTISMSEAIRIFQTEKRIFFSSPCQSGKTVAALSIMREMLLHERKETSLNPWYITFSNLIDSISNYNPTEIDPRKLFFIDSAFIYSPPRDFQVETFKVWIEKYPGHLILINSFRDSEIQQKVGKVICNSIPSIIKSWTWVGIQKNKKI
jgi:hypothetical protein